MAQSMFRDRPIQLRRDEEEEYISDEHDEDTQQGSEEEEGGTEISDADEQSSHLSSEEDEPMTEDSSAALGDISFGALAKAQATFSPLISSRKRKAAALDDTQPDTKSTPLEHSYKPPTKGSIKDGTRPNQPITRTSKHAPTILSSKHPVSRKRPLSLFDPAPTLKSRDPRFDPTITSSTLNPQSSTNANRNYSFLSTYQATEILALKSRIKKSNDPTETADLKRQVMSMESKIRNAEAQSREHEVRQRHKRAEREAIREGRKSQPYFLKQSEVKKEVERERVEGMGKRARDKMEKRKVKRVKGKEMRDMPGITRRRTGFSRSSER